MEANLLSRTDLIAAVEIQPEELEAWEKLGLIRSLAGSDGDSVYSSDTLDSARQIKTLLDIGYDLPAVQKIVRKVGLPAARGAGKKGAEKRLITVGELAENAGLNARTLRYWEERGIIQPDGRSTGGFRLYAPTTVTLVQLVKDLQVFGYSLDEIKIGADLLRDFFAFSEGLLPAAETEAIKRLDYMLEQIHGLEGRMTTMKQGIRRWEDLFRKRKKEITRLRDKLAGKGEK